MSKLWNIKEGRWSGYPPFWYTVLFMQTHLCTQVCLRLLCANSFYNSQGSKQWNLPQFSRALANPASSVSKVDVGKVFSRLGVHKSVWVVFPSKRFKWERAGTYLRKPEAYWTQLHWQNEDRGKNEVRHDNRSLIWRDAGYCCKVFEIARDFWVCISTAKDGSLWLWI